MPPPSLITACDQLLTLPTDTSQDERMSHYHPLYISNLKLLLLTYSVLCLAIIWLSKANWNRLRTNSTLLATTKTFHYKTINKLITLSIPGLSCQSIFNLSSVVFWLQEYWDRACLVFLFKELNNFDEFCLDMSKTTKLHHPSEEKKQKTLIVL